MAVSTHKVAASDGSTANPVQVQGGTFIDGGSASASPAISNRLAPGLSGAAKAAHAAGSGPKADVNAKKSRSGGDFAYQAEGKYVVRRMCDELNGLANDAINSGGSDTAARKSIHVRSDQIGAKRLTAYAAGNWRPTGISGQRTNWSTLNSANANYANNTGALSATADDAGRVTPWNSSGVPAELVYVETGKVSTANMKDYPYKSA